MQHIETSILMPDQVSSLSHWEVMKTHDPDRACTHLSSLFRPHKVRDHAHKDAMHFQHSRAELGNFSVNTLSYGKEVTIDARNNPVDSYLVTFTLRGSSEVKQMKNSFTTHPGTVCVLNPSLPLKDHMSKDFKMLIVQIDGNSLREQLSEELGISINQTLEFQPVSSSLTGKATSFARMVKMVCEDLADEHSELQYHQVNRQIERALVSLLLMEIPHTYSDRLKQEIKQPAPYIIRRTEDYIHTHLYERIVLDDLSAVSGVSGRTLQLAFKKYRGVTPMEYVRNYRLDYVRQQLTNRILDKSITQIALDSGFTHLSKFAYYYRERFGELPSETFTKRRFVS
jgi:AraC-like DNA-binding protein